MGAINPGKLYLLMHVRFLSVSVSYQSCRKRLPVQAAVMGSAFYLCIHVGGWIDGWIDPTTTVVFAAKAGIAVSSVLYRSIVAQNPG